MSQYSRSMWWCLILVPLSLIALSVGLVLYALQDNKNPGLAHYRPNDNGNTGDPRLPDGFDIQLKPLANPGSPAGAGPGPKAAPKTPKSKTPPRRDERNDPGLFFKLVTQIQNNDLFLLLCAIEYEALKDSGNRNRMLAQIAATNPYERIASLYEVTFDNGPKYLPERTASDKLLESLPENIRGNASYLVGRLYDVRSDKEYALKLYQASSTIAGRDWSLPTLLTAARIRELQKK